MGNSESTTAATVSDYAESQTEESQMAQNVVNDMSSVVAQQEMFIQQLTAEKEQLQSDLDAAERRKAQYKALCKKHSLI